MAQQSDPGPSRGSAPVRMIPAGWQPPGDGSPGRTPALPPPPPVPRPSSPLSSSTSNSPTDLRRSLRRVALGTTRSVVGPTSSSTRRLPSTPRAPSLDPTSTSTSPSPWGSRTDTSPHPPPLPASPRPAPPSSPHRAPLTRSAASPTPSPRQPCPPSTCTLPCILAPRLRWSSYPSGWERGIGGTLSAVRGRPQHAGTARGRGDPRAAWTRGRARAGPSPLVVRQRPLPSSSPRVFPFSVAGTPSSNHTGAGAPLRKWSKNCCMRMAQSF